MAVENVTAFVVGWVMLVVGAILQQGLSQGRRSGLVGWQGAQRLTPVVHTLRLFLTKRALVKAPHLPEVRKMARALAPTLLLLTLAALINDMNRNQQQHSREVSLLGLRAEDRKDAGPRRCRL